MFLSSLYCVFPTHTQVHNTKQVILLVIDIESLKLSLAVAPFCSFWFVKISQVFSLTKKYEHLNEVKECFNCITFIFHVLFNACWDQKKFLNEIT